MRGGMRSAGRVWGFGLRVAAVAWVVAVVASVSACGEEQEAPRSVVELVTLPFDAWQGPPQVVEAGVALRMDVAGAPPNACYEFDRPLVAQVGNGYGVIGYATRPLGYAPNNQNLECLKASGSDKAYASSVFVSGLAPGSVAFSSDGFDTRDVNIMTPVRDEAASCVGRESAFSFNALPPRVARGIAFQALGKVQMASTCERLRGTSATFGEGGAGKGEAAGSLFVNARVDACEPSRGDVGCVTTNYTVDAEVTVTPQAQAGVYRTLVQGAEATVEVVEAETCAVTTPDRVVLDAATTAFAGQATTLGVRVTMPAGAYVANRQRIIAGGRVDLFFQAVACGDDEGGTQTLLVSETWKPALPGTWVVRVNGIRVGTVEVEPPCEKVEAAVAGLQLTGDRLRPLSEGIFVGTPVNATLSVLRTSVCDAIAEPTVTVEGGVVTIVPRVLSCASGCAAASEPTSMSVAVTGLVAGSYSLTTPGTAPVTFEVVEGDVDSVGVPPAAGVW